MRAWIALMVVPCAAAALVGSARSSDTEELSPIGNVRCAMRVGIALTGKAPTGELLAAADPQAQLDTVLASPDFVDQFARFINSKLNDAPGANAAEDAAFVLAKYVLQNQRPWHELFDGPYRIEGATVIQDPDGLGYFRSRPWMVRYAGNEPAGYRLAAAFRIQQNIIGLDVGAVTSAPEVDISATGREAAECRSCHYDSYFALDKVAKILSRVQDDGATVRFVPSTEPAQMILDGQLIGSDADLVGALVESTDHQFRTCRLAFEFLYGRAEATCEAALFDQCMDAYASTGDIRAALRTIAVHPTFCE